MLEIIKHSGYTRMGTAAREYGQDVLHERLASPTIQIKEPGYVYVYLSNEETTPVEVYFDDFKVTQTKTNIIQYNEYYPFGLQTNASWTREGSSNNFLYNAGSELSTSTGWYETPFRNYDAAIGRFISVDPLATKYAPWSGYHYAGNNPVMMNDPTGADPTTDEHEYMYRYYNGQGGGLANYDGPTGGGYAAMDQYGNMLFQNPGYNWRGSVPDAYAYHMNIAAEEQRLLNAARNGDTNAAKAYASMRGHYESVQKGSEKWRNILLDFSIRWDLNHGLMLACNCKGVCQHMQTQGGDLAWIARSVANAFFGDQMKKYGASITWVVRPEEGWDAETRRLRDGTVQTTIATRVLGDPTRTYLTIGHDLIHAADYLNGNYDNWMAALSGRVADQDKVYAAVMLSEYGAYQWSANLESQFNVNYGHQSELGFVTNELNRLGIMDMLKK